MEYKYSAITGLILRAAMNVHGALGNGFPEVIYQRSLLAEFELLNIDYGREINRDVYYKGVHVGTRRVDFLIDKKICVELKAVILLDNAHLAQAKNYLEAFNLEVGLLINFGAKSLEWKRIYNNKYSG